MQSIRVKRAVILALAATLCRAAIAEDRVVESPLDQAALRVSLLMEDYRNTTRSITSEPSWQNSQSPQCPPEAKAEYAQAITKLAHGWNEVLMQARRDSVPHGDPAACRSKLQPYSTTLAEFESFASKVLHIETKADLINAMVHVGTPLAMQITQSMTGVMYCYIDFSPAAGNTDNSGNSSHRAKAVDD